MGPDIAQGGGCRLLHHLTEAAGELETTIQGMDQGCLDGQGGAPHGGPGQARDDAEALAKGYYVPHVIEPSAGVDRLTLARLFQKHGYATGAVGKWHLGFGAGDTPTTSWLRMITATSLELPPP